MLHMCYRPSMGSRTLNADVGKFFLGVCGPRRRHHINMQKPREISYKVGHNMLPLPLCTFILLYLSCLFHSDPLTLTPCNTSYTWIYRCPVVNNIYFKPSIFHYFKVMFRVWGSWSIPLLTLKKKNILKR